MFPARGWPPTATRGETCSVEPTAPAPARGRWASSQSPEPQSERGVDLQLPQQESALIEAPATQPAGYFLVPLAGVVSAAGRGDIVERVAPAARDRQHVVALEWLANHAE